VSDLPHLDLSADVLTLTRALVDAPSVSGDEADLADAVEAALRALGGLEVERVGDTVLARTNLGLPTRVVLADTWTPCRSPTTCPPTCAKPTGYSGCTDVAPVT
jgi:acetylornithine deacetylase/succinyl-diaminopimelate desuccinylase-like protein